MALVIALVMCMAMGVTAFAAPVEGDTFTYTDTGKTDDGQISMANATKDVTYTLYKIFDATYSGSNVSYTIKAGKLLTALKAETDISDYFTFGATPDANGNYSVSRAGTTTDGVFTATKTDSELIDFIKRDTLTANYTEIGAIKSTVNGEIKWDKIPYGYYYISPDQPVSDAAVTIDSNTPTVNVLDKNQKPSFDKKIVDIEGNLVALNEASTGETVNFNITTQAKNYDGEEIVFKYVIQDTLESGWTFGSAAPVVKIVDAKDADSIDSAIAKTAGTDYTIKYYTDSSKVTEVTGTDKTTAQYFEIEIPWTDDGTKDGASLYAANSVIQVTYSAFLDAANKTSSVEAGTNHNDNTGDVKYYKGDDTTTPSGDLTDKTTETYTTSLTITKQDQDGNALEGAEFTLTTSDGADILITTTNAFAKAADGTYYLLKDGTYTTEAPTGDETHDAVYESKTDLYKKTTTVTAVGEDQTTSTLTGTVDDEGKITFTGLGVGTYTLSESVVPNGYNRAADITFTISFDANEKKDGEANPNYKKFSSNNSAIALDSTNNVFNTTIVNNKGTELPSTGGMGTTLFYIIGAVIVAGAVVLLVARRKVSTEK